MRPITAVYNGAHADTVDLLGPMQRLPLLQADLYDMVLPLWEDQIGKSTLVGNRLGYIRPGIVPIGGMPPEVGEIYQSFVADAPSPDSFVVWTHRGGAISRVAPDATAFVHRDPGFVYKLKAIWTEQADTRANVESAYHFDEALRPHFKGAYANYIDPLRSDWPDMYYGANYERLSRIKRAVDPDDLFGFQQGIRSQFRPTSAAPLDLSPLNRAVAPEGDR